MNSWEELLQAEKETEFESLPIPRNRQEKPKVKLSREPRTWGEEQLEVYYRSILWNNPTFVRDSRAFYALANKVKKEKGEATLISVLRYCQEKGKLFPRYIIAVLNAKLKKL